MKLKQKQVPEVRCYDYLTMCFFLTFILLLDDCGMFENFELGNLLLLRAKWSFCRNLDDNDSEENRFNKSLNCGVLERSEDTLDIWDSDHFVLFKVNNL